MKQILFIISLCGAVMHLNAQQNKVIFLKTGEKVDYAKFKGTLTKMEYKNQAGSKQLLNYDDIHFIIKKKAVFIPVELTNNKFYLKDGPLTVGRSDIDPQGSCTKGMVDAISNTDFRGARLVGLVTGLFMPIGFVGTAVIASTPPDANKLSYPANVNSADNDYKACYLNTVKKQKSKQTWYGASIGASLAVLIGGAVFAGTY